MTGKTFRRGFDVLTPPERMEKLVKGEKPDRVPFIPFLFGYAAKVCGYEVGDVYADAEKSFRALVLCQEMFGYDGSPLYGYASYGAWEFGGEIHFPYGKWEQAPTVTRHPAGTAADAAALEVPDVPGAGCIPIMRRFGQLAFDRGMPVTMEVGTPFTMAGAMIGENQMLRWMIKRPDLVHRVLRKATDFCIGVAEYFAAEFGAGRLMAFDGGPTEANQLISARQFAEFALPYVKEIHEKLLAMGVPVIFSHVCGEQNLNLEHWRTVPMGRAGIMSFGAEVDLDRAIEIFGDDVIIAGNVDPTIIQVGTPEEVYEITKQTILKGKKAPRGFVLMAGCEVPVLAPPINIYYMWKALQDHGFYT